MPRYAVLVAQYGKNSSSILNKGWVETDAYSSEEQLRVNFLNDLAKQRAVQEVQKANLPAPNKTPILQPWDALQWSIGVRNVILEVKRLK